MDAGGRIRLRLAAMMALIDAVQGASWLVLSLHLFDVGVSERGRGWIFATMAIASFAVPLAAGRLVDRLMPTQRFLSAAFAGGGLILAYWLVMAPSNLLAFRNLARPDRDYPRVRLWGTVGWMAAVWVVSGAMGVAGPARSRGTAEAFWIAAGLSLATSI